MGGSLVKPISIHVPREGHDRLYLVGLLDRLPISIHVPREGHDGVTMRHIQSRGISIHVPREGHDTKFRRACALLFYFNPRAPRGARHRRRYQGGGTSKFQSTCPARGTTISNINLIDGHNNFNPRAPRGARPSLYLRIVTPPVISIHVPREGHDEDDRVRFFAAGISIHVPREGHDPSMVWTPPRPLQFQSTCPARGTT